MTTAQDGEGGEKHPHPFYATLQSLDTLSYWLEPADSRAWELHPVGVTQGKGREGILGQNRLRQG